MIPRFPAEGDWALVDSTWWPVSTINRDRGPLVILHFSVRADYDAFHVEGEVERTWSRDKGLVDVDPSAIDELVEVRWTGRYRGLDVFPRGPVRDGWVTVSPVSLAEDAGEDLGFRGSARFGDRDKRIPVDEFVEVSEQVKVVYRRGEVWPRG